MNAMGNSGHGKPKSPRSAFRDTRSIFEQVMNKIEDEERRLAYPNAFGHCDAEFDAPIHVSGVRATKTTFQADIRRVSRQVRLSSLVVYADPIADNRVQAVVGLLELGTSEIVEASDRVVMVVDLSQISIPPNQLFHNILYDFGRIVELRGVKFIGLPDTMIFQGTISFRFENS